MNSRLLPFWVLATLLITQQCSGQTVQSFDDVEFWVGSGANCAAFVIDWDGESSSDESYVWGYRWDDAASGADLLLDVVAADPRFYARLSENAGFGTAVVGLGYDQNDDGQFGITDNTAFDATGIHSGDLSDLETAIDPADFYAEGWFLGFWHLGAASENPFDGGAWSTAGSGIAGLTLSDQSWVSLAFTTDTFSHSDFAATPRAAIGPLSADFDSDADVDGADFLTWQRGFGIDTNTLPSQGDANRDGQIDAWDLAAWQSAYGNATHFTARTAFVVPEPATLRVAVSFLFFLFLIERRVS